MVAQEKNRRDEAIKARDAAIAQLRADRAERGEDRAIRKEDREIWRQGIAEFTTKTAGGFDGPTEITRWEDLAKKFDADGRDDLAADARSRISNEIDKDSTEWLQAGIDAKKNAKKRDPSGINYFNEEGMKEAYGEGGIDAWIEAEQLRLYQEETGISGTAAPTASSSGDYKTKEDVKKAYQSGELSREEASELLKSFGGT